MEQMTSAYISKVNFEQNEKIKGCTARIYLNALLLLTHSQSFVLGLLLRKSTVIPKDSIVFFPKQITQNIYNQLQSKLRLKLQVKYVSL